MPYRHREYTDTSCLQSKNIVLGSIAPNTVTADAGKVLAEVVPQIDTTVIKAGNIKKDIVILGQTGTYEGEAPTLQDKTVTTNGTVTADAGYDGLDEVTVAVPATPTQTKTLTLGSAAPAAVTPDSGYALSQVTPQIDSTVIKAENIAQGATILGIAGSHSGGGGVQVATGMVNVIAGTDFVITHNLNDANAHFIAFVKTSPSIEGASLIVVTDTTQTAYTGPAIATRSRSSVTARTANAITISGVGVSDCVMQWVAWTS